MHYSDMVDEDLFADMVAQGYIKVQSHPHLDLLVYNYTVKTVIENQWNDVTKRCRGLILHRNGQVVARPFEKFFNLSENPHDAHVLGEPYTIQDKMDGSLGICYLDDAFRPQIATRGSFTSEQALRGSEILKQNYGNFYPGTEWTFLFEIIYPENRIVVDYHGQSDLILLAVIETKSGLELNVNDAPVVKSMRTTYHWTGPIVKDYPAADEYGERLSPRIVTKALGHNDGSMEGFVLKFGRQKPTRIKVKMDEYVRLHRIMTNISSKTIWTFLVDGKDLEEIYQSTPEEVSTWAREMADELVTRYKVMKEAIFFEYNMIVSVKMAAWDSRNPAYRKRFASLAKETDYPDFMFALLDGHNISRKIWDRLEPAFSRPFSDDELVEVGVGL